MASVGHRTARRIRIAAPPSRWGNLQASQVHFARVLSRVFRFIRSSPCTVCSCRLPCRQCCRSGNCPKLANTFRGRAINDLTETCSTLRARSAQSVIRQGFLHFPWIPRNLGSWESEWVNDSSEPVQSNRDHLCLARILPAPAGPVSKTLHHGLRSIDQSNFT